jgi:opacity protein-like surface antigen
MKKKLVALLTVLMVIWMSSSITAVSAQPNASRPIKCVVDIQTNEPGIQPDWYGTVSGCILEGNITFTETNENYVAGKTGHFFEDFVIHPASGGEIVGYNGGVWNFSTFKFRANGYVTSASEEWAYLVGYKYHEMGVTSSPDEPIIYALGTMMTLHTP